MAKKPTAPIDKKKLEISRVLYALDTRDKEFYNNLTDEEKKLYSPVVLLRFMSSAQNQGGYHEYHLEMVNEIVNQDMWEITKHPELIHKLFSVCGSGKKQYHDWIANSKKTNSSKLENLFKSIYPDMNDLEFSILIKSNSEKDIIDLCKDQAYDDKEIKEIVKQYNAYKNEK